uniref:CRIB domain-containing protein n=1 Tax=Bactrocera dorsalis TaxID=27457 RepID=A0A034WNX3_BACDO
MALRTVFMALWPFLLCFDYVISTHVFNVRKHRQARTLIYPPTAPTRLQFIGGIGIPVEDLTYESVTSGYVLKAEYFLPETADKWRPTELSPQSVNRRSFGDDDDYHNNTTTHAQKSTERQSASFHTNWQSKQQTAAAYRWLIYKAMEILMNRAGLAGRECMLRSICEHAAVPLHYDNGILGEILHIILAPSRSHDELGSPNDKDYGHAEHIGRKGGDCAATYATCAYAPIEQITTVLELDD